MKASARKGNKIQIITMQWTSTFGPLSFHLMDLTCFTVSKLVSACYANWVKWFPKCVFFLSKRDEDPDGGQRKIKSEHIFS